MSSNGATLQSASTARAAAHPYANARASRRTSSFDEKPHVSPTSVISPTEDIPTTTGRAKKKTSSVPQQQPKSSRQQFSACHACRYRRVKCDLKDRGEDADPSGDISCTNCRERGIRCKDDYAESKKQLRRGKRINQLELEDNLMDNTEDIGAFSLRPRVTIPNLKPEFFDSPFYRRFYIQRPIIDPVEFRSRYIAWLQHHTSPESNASLSSATTPLSAEGQLLAKVLVVWAAAYGVDEAGAEQPGNSYQDVQKRRLRVKGMIEEIIHLVDSLGLLRRPSWDGVRCLLMTLPLTEDVLDNPMDRLSMYEGAVQQVYTLCQHEGVATGLTAEARAANSLVRARIFWYAHVHEGLTTGLRGGRLIMHDEDLNQFHKELPSPSSFANRQALQPSNMTYSLAFQYATAPIRLASACRKVHAALTGPKARSAKRLDGKKLEDTWEALAVCWEEFESLRPIQRNDYLKNEDNLRFVDGWQIFLFECYNVIQEKIRDRLDAVRAAQITEEGENPDSPGTVESLVRDLNKYLAIAESKCYDLLDHVVVLIRRHLGSSFFAYDASLVRDGCFFAGHTLAMMPGRDEDVKACLQALSEMRWAFSKGYERSQAIKLAWRSRADYHPYQPPVGQPDPDSDSRRNERTQPDGTPGSSAPDARRHEATGSHSGTSTGNFPHVSSLPTHIAASQITPTRILPRSRFSQTPSTPSPKVPEAVVQAPDNSRPQLSIPKQSTLNNKDQWSPSHGHGSPVMLQPIPRASTHSSSSDGSSPPELSTTQPISQYPPIRKSPPSHQIPPGTGVYQTAHVETVYPSPTRHTMLPSPGAPYQATIIPHLAPGYHTPSVVPPPHYPPVALATEPMAMAGYPYIQHPTTHSVQPQYGSGYPTISDSLAYGSIGHDQYLPTHVPSTQPHPPHTQNNTYFQYAPSGVYYTQR
ncbi:hypothetical protein PIIN_03957 [Serendipita indica DSM 11827]|uniref:Zn(2)-C6 fungal-type domain-containing protein n=1 Tax=Serendipita indica (strain DSM 11827) TaxID=1109443 RepID=G4TFC4_SERID|nr:hypothetical protein PIIN_03957 [Serendipita indica DSM 11827]